MSQMIFQATDKVVRRVGLANLVALLLLCVAILCLVIGLHASMKGLDIWPLLAFGLAGLLFGWLLGSSALQGWAAAIIAILTGSTIGILVLGRIANPTGRLILAELRWGWQVLRLKRLNLESLAGLDRSEILQAWQGLGSAWINFLDRAGTWFASLFGGRPAFDPLVVLLGWSLIVWLAAVWAGWWVRGRNRSRERVLIGLAPSGILLAGYVAYTGTPIYPIAIWLAALIALQALGDYRKQTLSWQARQIDKAEIEMEWGAAVVVIIACLFTFSLAVPSITIHRIADPIRQALNPDLAGQNDLAGALGMKNPNVPAPTALERAQSPGLPNRRLLGAGPELSERIVMWVNLEGNDPVPPSADLLEASTAEIKPPSYYWRSLTYDRYTGRGWAASPASQESYAGGASIAQQLISAGAVPYQFVQQHIHMAEPGTKAGTLQEGSARLLYVAGELMSASEAYQVAWRRPGDIFGVQVKANDYRAASRLPRPTPQQLRSAGDEYPDAIRQDYLNLPESVPRRVWDLAVDLTSTQPTPYDQALAIESYLRRFPYTLDMKAPPADRDVVDYFLFNLKRGYCDYYATAMVVLARAAGLPARLVVGYASGEYLPQETRFVVTEADAHAWAEVYFPGYGWVEFEPTASRPALDRPEVPGADVQAGTAETAGSAKGTIVGISWQQIRWGLAALLGAALLALLWLALDWLRLGWLPPQQVIHILYRRLYRQARRFDSASPGSTTPHEFAAQFGQHLQLTDPTGPDHLHTSNLQNQIDNIANSYAETIYSPHLPGAVKKRSTLVSWRMIQTGLWKARLQQALHRITNPRRQKGPT